MKKALVTGSGGLVGSEGVRFLGAKGYEVHGIDNDMRAHFFGPEASTAWMIERLSQEKGLKYVHHALDICDRIQVEKLMQEIQPDVILHAAAQPSHDWAVRDPHLDFNINAQGTLNLLEAARKHAPECPFIYCSTNKVYGDTCNLLPLVEGETRWEVHSSHSASRYGIDETMSVDQTRHSLFGASKLAADILVQEYGRYFGMPTVSFRGGCLTGPAHSGAELHGFLAYMVRCSLEGRTYRVFGYKGKQVRDNIHSEDLMQAFWHYIQNPRAGEVYNIGGGMRSNCSLMEAAQIIENLGGPALKLEYVEENRIGDHIWWISDVGKFSSHYPDFQPRYGIEDILGQILEELRRRG